VAGLVNCENRRWERCALCFVAHPFQFC